MKGRDKMGNTHPNYFICDCSHQWTEVLAERKRKAVCPECGNKHYPIPSVTTIIGNQLGWNKQTLLNWYAREFRAGRDPENKRDVAANTGTVCHEYIEAFAQDREIDGEVLTKASMDDIIIAENGLKQFKSLLESKDYKITHSEVAVFSTEHKYGGRIDYGINGHILGDIKTSSNVYPDHIIQLAAYDLALRESNIFTPDEWVIYHIKKDITSPDEEIVKEIVITKEQIEEGLEIFKTLLWLKGKQKSFKVK